MTVRIVLYLIGGLFGLLALLAIAQAIFLGFVQLVPMGWAALLAALSYLVIMGFVFMLAQLRTRKSSSSSLKKILPLVASNVQRNPARSVFAALAAGALLQEIEKRSRR